MRARRLVQTMVAMAAMPILAAAEVDWESIRLTKHSEYQAVNASGGSTYAGFPVRLRGIILNNPEDWLNPAPNSFFDPGSWRMGGEWEIFVQAADADDFGGTSAWIGQNYGNSYRNDPAYSYTDAQWIAEVLRLDYAGQDPATAPKIRAGDYVEIRARVGLNYQGKRNINEAHDNDHDRFDDPDTPEPDDGDGVSSDFEIVLLQRNMGLPEPALLTLADLKDAANAFIFDPARAAGGEHHQATRVRLGDVRLTEQSLADWGPNRDLMIEDASGRTLGIHIGLNASFAGMAAPVGFFDVVGILDQKDPLGTGGYRLLAMNAADFTVPEPASGLSMALGALVLLHRRRRA